MDCSFMENESLNRWWSNKGRFLKRPPSSWKCLGRKHDLKFDSPILVTWRGPTLYRLAYTYYGSFRSDSKQGCGAINLQGTKDCVDDTNWTKYFPSRSLTKPLKSYLPNRKVVFQPPFFRGYVKLRVCMRDVFFGNLLEVQKVSFLLLQGLYTNIPTIFQQGVFGSEIILLRKLSNLPFVGLSCYSWQTFWSQQIKM